ncbi:MAG: hypothetical protein E7Z90_03580 [Cyanobacteria bacterium SIG29]|nr:hypothetical protein [Cyanobacteria bacterium SIG29]
MYTNKDLYTEKDDKQLVYLTLFTAFANEQVCTIMVFLMFLVLIESFFNKESHSKFVLKKLCKLIPIAMTFYLLYAFTYSITSVVRLSFSGFIATYGSVAEYLNLFKHIFIEENIHLWLFIVSLVVIICIKEKKTIWEPNNGSLKIVLYSYLSCFLFYIGLYFWGQTYHHPVEVEDMIYPKYWLLYPAFKMFLKMFLLSSILYLLSYIFSRKGIDIICKNILLFIVIMSLSIYIYKNYKYSNIFFSPEGRKTLYLMDKLTVFYANKKLPVIYPYENMQLVWFFEEETITEDIKNKNFGKIYYDCTYLKYISYLYKVDTSKGMMFKTYDEAMKDFVSAGGSIDENELEELKFSKIKELLK